MERKLSLNGRVWHENGGIQIVAMRTGGEWQITSGPACLVGKTHRKVQWLRQHTRNWTKAKRKP